MSSLQRWTLNGSWAFIRSVTLIGSMQMRTLIKRWVAIGRVLLS